MRWNRDLILVIVLGLVGLGTAGWYGPMLVREAYATQGWTESEAEILSSTVDAESRTRSGGRSEVDWVVELEYRYTVEGQDYTSERFMVASDLGADTQTEAERLARAYRAGDRVPVWIDPEDPTAAVLQRGGVGKAWANLGFGVLLLGVAVYLYFARVRDRPASWEDAS